MFLEQRLRRVCCVRDLYVGGVYLWVASVGLGDVVDQPQSVVQPESACNDGVLVRSVSERIGILGNARSVAEVCVDGVGKFFFLVLLKLLCVLLLQCHVRAAAPRLTLLSLITDSFPLLSICTS